MSLLHFYYAALYDILVCSACFRSGSPLFVFLQRRFARCNSHAALLQTDYMSEIPRGDDNEEQFLAKQAEGAEFGRLSDEVLLLRSQIETGEHTDRTHLDKFLTTQ